MQRGRGGLLHHFEMFIAGVDGKKTVFVSVVSCGNSSASEVQLFMIILGNFLFEEMNEFFVFSEIVGMSGCDLESGKEFREGFL